MELTLARNSSDQLLAAYPGAPTIQLHSTKYDGSLHYRYPVTVIHQDPDLLITFAGVGTPIESYRGKWLRDRQILTHFFRHRPYVLHVMWNHDWTPWAFYVDVAAQTTWDDTTVRYIDLDLDLIRNAHQTEIILDDADEFEAHTIRFNYPPDLVTACHAAVAEIRNLLTKEIAMFHPQTYTFRPGSVWTPRFDGWKLSTRE